VSTYHCCRPDNDPASWTDVDAYDEQLAATVYVERICSRDAECYSAFVGGELVLVRDAAGSQAFEVTLEMVPHFAARRLK
jgi:hypothetical protein